jgi:hypothetical protein
MGLDQAWSMRILTVGHTRFLKPRAAGQISKAGPDVTVPERGPNCQHGRAGSAALADRSTERFRQGLPASAGSLAGP